MKRIGIALAIGLVACAGRYHIPSPDYDRSRFEEVGWGEGHATGVLIFNGIPIGMNSKLESAFREAIEENHGDAITDVTIQERWAYWGIFVGGFSVRVHGMVLRRIDGARSESTIERRPRPAWSDPEQWKKRDPDEHK